MYRKNPLRKQKIKRETENHKLEKKSVPTLVNHSIFRKGVVYHLSISKFPTFKPPFFHFCRIANSHIITERIQLQKGSSEKSEELAFLDR